MILECASGIEDLNEARLKLEILLKFRSCIFI